MKNHILFVPFQKHAKDVYAIKHSHQKKERTKSFAQKDVPTFREKRIGREEIIKSIKYRKILGKRKNIIQIQNMLKN